MVVTGSVEVYERDGRYQIYAREIELDGAGGLYLKFEALKRELEEMGMFAEEYKQPIPRFARRIGIVTAPTGAAVQDIRKIAAGSYPAEPPTWSPARVQGAGAAASSVNGIHALEQLGVDVMIVGRGGGSIEDLWAFNEEIVARAIFECTVPVISAVGHQTDWTIADYVADLRAPTPSAAAELAVFDYVQTKHMLAELKHRMDMRLKQRIEGMRAVLEQYKLRMRYLSPQSRLNENRRKAVDYEERMQTILRDKLKDRRHRLSLLAGSLESYSPARKLSQGYAYVEGTNGKALRSVDQVKVDDTLTIHLLDGSLKACVTERSFRASGKNEGIQSDEADS